MPPPTMTLAEAVAMLNRHRHHGHAGWYISGGDGDDPYVFGADYYEVFSPFEALAIAEKYGRLSSITPGSSSSRT